jgi:hypothetical protein
VSLLVPAAASDQGPTPPHTDTGQTSPGSVHCDLRPVTGHSEHGVLTPTPVDTAFLRCLPWLAVAFPGTADLDGVHGHGAVNVCCRHRNGTRDGNIASSSDYHFDCGGGCPVADVVLVELRVCPSSNLCGMDMSHPRPSPSASSPHTVVSTKSTCAFCLSFMKGPKDERLRTADLSRCNYLTNRICISNVRKSKSIACVTGA